MDAAYDFGRTVHQRIERNVEAERLQSRTFREQRPDQESFATSDVEDTHAEFQSVLRDDVTRHRMPAAVVAVAAVAVFPRPVPIHLAILPGDGDYGRILALGALLDIALGLRQGAQQVEVRHQPNSCCCARASPASIA